MEAWVRRLRLEAEDVAVGNVVGDGGEVALEGLFTAELVVLAAGEFGDGFGDVALDGVADGDEGHLGDAQGWGEHGDTIEGLLRGAL